MIHDSSKYDQPKKFIEISTRCYLVNNAPHNVGLIESLPDQPMINVKQIRNPQTRRSLNKLRGFNRLGIADITHWLLNLPVSKLPPRQYKGEHDYYRLQKDLITSFTAQWNMGLVIKPIRFNSRHNLPAFIDRYNFDLQSVLLTLPSKYKGIYKFF